MESSSFSLIVPIVVGVIVFLIEKATEKKSGSRSRHTDSGQPRKRPASHTPRTSSLKPSAPPRTTPPAPLPSSDPLPEEGIRVTDDKPLAPPPSPKKAPAVSPAALRRAIIWSEILRRKF